MTRPRDPRTLIWGLLGLWVGIELLYSSRWWPPAAAPQQLVAAAPAVPDNSLRSLLAGLPRAPGVQTRVWFAPYTTYPETGLLESVARRGVYDTFLAIPNTGLAANYGASKLTPADTLFTLVSAHGLPAEFRLAQQLGFQWFALDLGAVNAPDAAVQLCRSTSGCRLSGDAYALFPIRAGADRSMGPARLQRRLPLLPWQSAGISWGPLVFNPLQWGPVDADPGRPLPADARLLVKARSLTRLQIYRYRLDQYPQSVQAALELANGDVVLKLPAEVDAAQICIGPVGGACKQIVSLVQGRRQLAIGDLLSPGQVTQLEVVDIRRIRPGDAPLAVELKTPAAARALLRTSSGGSVARPDGH